MSNTNRQQFQEELAGLEAAALGGLDLVAQALDRALETVQHQDVELAGMVIADDDRIDGRYLEVHQGILSLLALQAPVAGDLRLVAALLHVIKHIERMGDQCVNMAKLVPLAGHEPPADTEMIDKITRMGELARSLVVQCKQAFERRDEALAQDLVRQDDEIDRLTHDIIHQMYATESGQIEREDVHALAAAIDDVVDYTEEAADVLGLYKIEAPMEQAVELTGVLRDAGRELAAALAKLDRLPELSPHLVEVDRLEDEGDRVSRSAIVSLFVGGIDPMVVIRWKDVFERLEQAIDACERVAHVLEGIVVKQA